MRFKTNLFFLLVFSQIAYATEKNLPDFLQLAEKTARLEFELSERTLAWRSKLPSYLTPVYQAKPDFNFHAIKTPAKYYSHNSTYLKKLKSENKKLVVLEASFTQKEFRQMTKAIDANFKTLDLQRANISSENIKRIILDFHDMKLNIFPAALDNILGIEYENIESLVSRDDYDPVDACIDTVKNNSQTKYEDIRVLFQYLKLSNTDVFYDLGSGYGRVVFYGGLLNPMIPFKGIEIVRQRVSYANSLLDKLKLKNVRFIANDVLAESYDDGTVFYIYNAFPSIMKLVMAKLELISKKHPIRIISLGHSYGDYKNFDWLELEKDLRPGRSGFALEVYRSKL